MAIKSLETKRKSNKYVSKIYWPEWYAGRYLQNVLAVTTGDNIQSVKKLCNKSAKL